MHHSKQYKKLFKKHRKEIMKQAKKASKNPFDFGVGLELFVKHLYFMHDYYELGENVWAQENEEITRLEMLNQILAEYLAWDRCIDFFAETKWTKEKLEEFKNSYKKHRKNFFLLLDKYIEELWD